MSSDVPAGFTIGHPSSPGIYIAWDGHWQRRLRYNPGYRWRGHDCTWSSLRGYPPVWPEPIAWRDNDPLWGIEPYPQDVVALTGDAV